MTELEKLKNRVDELERRVALAEQIVTIFKQANAETYTRWKREADYWRDLFLKQVGGEADASTVRASEPERRNPATGSGSDSG